MRRSRFTLDRGHHIKCGSPEPSKSSRKSRDRQEVKWNYGSRLYNIEEITILIKIVRKHTIHFIVSYDTIAIFILDYGIVRYHTF